MSWLGQLGNLAQQFAAGTVRPEDAENHYEQLTSAAPQSAVMGALADAMRSDQTPPFAQMAAQLFGSSNGDQKANLLNQLLTAAGPMLPAALGSMAGGNVTPEMAQQISPEMVQEVAQSAHDQDASIIDRVSSIYAGHPTLVKTLGGAVLAVALAKFAERTKA